MRKKVTEIMGKGQLMIIGLGATVIAILVGILIGGIYKLSSDTNTTAASSKHVYAFLNNEWVEIINTNSIRRYDNHHIEVYTINGESVELYLDNVIITDSDKDLSELLKNK